MRSRTFGRIALFSVFAFLSVGVLGCKADPAGSRWPEDGPSMLRDSLLASNTNKDQPSIVETGAEKAAKLYFEKLRYMVLAVSCRIVSDSEMRASCDAHVLSDFYGSDARDHLFSVDCSLPRGHKEFECGLSHQ